jgi:LPXTG-motif cell wall-anchored protein
MQGTTNPATPGTTETDYGRSDHNFGWIGIIGLAGLAGLMRRNRTEVDTTRTRP